MKKQTRSNETFEQKNIRLEANMIRYRIKKEKKHANIESSQDLIECKQISQNNVNIAFKN